MIFFLSFNEGVIATVTLFNIQNIATLGRVGFTSQMSVVAGWPCLWVLAFCAGC